MTFIEVIKQAQVGDIIDLAYPYDKDYDDNKPYATYAIGKNNTLLYVDGVEANLEEMNKPMWSIRQ